MNDYNDYGEMMIINIVRNSAKESLENLISRNVEVRIVNPNDESITLQPGFTLMTFKSIESLPGFTVMQV